MGSDISCNADTEEKAIKDLFAGDTAIIEKIAELNVDQTWKKVVFRRRNVFIRGKLLLASRYVAAVLLLLSAGYYWGVHKMAVDNQSGHTVVSIPCAEMGNVILPDGTKIVLNSSSELKYPSHFPDLREVFLTGEAFFDVKSDSRNPFVVHLKDFSVKVTGTRFNIKSYPDMRAEATLEEGKIAVTNHDGHLVAELEPSENLVYAKDQNRFFITRTDARQISSWKEGKIAVKNQTVEEIAKIIERWFNVKIEFLDNSIKQVRLTGTIMRDYPIDELLEVLVASESVGFELSTQSDGTRTVYFQKKSDKQKATKQPDTRLSL